MSGFARNAKEKLLEQTHNPQENAVGLGGNTQQGDGKDNPEVEQLIEKDEANPSPKCTKCGGEMEPGKALEQTATGLVTMSPGGPGRLIDCLKCRACGFSVRLEN